MDGVKRELPLVYIFALEGIEREKHADSKRTGCSESGAGRQICLVVKPYIAHVKILHCVPDSRMLNVIDSFGALDFAVGNQAGIVKERREMAYRDRAVLVKGCGDDAPAVFPVEIGVVSPPRKTTFRKESQ